MKQKKRLSMYRRRYCAVYHIPPAVYSRYGFSYAEFLIVITLIVITALGTTVSLFSFVQNQAPQSAARAIRAMLRDAQQRSIAQEEGRYWGVRFQNFPAPSRDVYTLIKSEHRNGSSPATVSVVYLSNSVQLVEPAGNQNIMFDKITGDLIVSVCPSAVESSRIIINTISIRIYCNGKIE